MQFYFLFFLIFFIYLAILIKRIKKYNYSVQKDYTYDLTQNFIKDIEYTTGSITIVEADYDTLFLRVELQPSLLSYIAKPYIEIENKKHYFEYGAQGVRYLNLSHLKERSFTLKLKHIALNKTGFSLYGYTNNINLDNDSLLILAPHADDAELAAFGLYKSASNITLVTTTIGEHGNCNYCDIYKDEAKATQKKAQLRMIDAITTGLQGDVDIQNALALGYYGGSLKWMYENPTKEAHSLRKSITDMNKYRAVSHAAIQLPNEVEATYNAFVQDLATILTAKKPTHIITPHPVIDSHPDHKYTTYALIDAIKQTHIECKLLTYTNHLQTSELYPIGAIYSPINLPPNFQPFYFDSLFSFELNKELKIDKFFALESLHDLRDSALQISIKKAYKHFVKLLSRAIKGKDKSYYRRAVRSNELFFVIEGKNIEKLKV
jgi:LmbE family N-acetylglucosaminyl deacetylase